LIRSGCLCPVIIYAGREDSNDMGVERKAQEKLEQLEEQISRIDFDNALPSLIAVAKMLDIDLEEDHS
jgi:hypothetical protein